jgi:hypothetical protein
MNDNTSKLQQAQTILQQPLTLASIRAFNQLADSATGEEAERISDLQEALFVAVSADEQLFAAAMREGLL